MLKKVPPFETSVRPNSPLCCGYRRECVTRFAGDQCAVPAPPARNEEGPWRTRFEKVSFPSNKHGLSVLQLLLWSAAPNCRPRIARLVESDSQKPCLACIECCLLIGADRNGRLAASSESASYAASNTNNLALYHLTARAASVLGAEITAAATKHISPSLLIDARHCLKVQKGDARRKHYERPSTEACPRG